jgi:hypothetical protein
MQLPHHCLSPLRIRNGVGIAENGSAIKISPFDCSTKAR